MNLDNLQPGVYKTSNGPEDIKLLLIQDLMTLLLIRIIKSCKHRQKLGFAKLQLANGLNNWMIKLESKYLSAKSQH